MAVEQISDLVQRLSQGQLSRRQFMRRAVALGLTAPAISAILAASAEAAPRAGGVSSAARLQSDTKTLVIADNLQGSGLWLYLDPGHFYEINPTSAMNVIYETLYHLPDGNKLTDFQPLLADGMPQVAADGLTLTVKLKQGVKFQNSGNPMTADDVIFSWKRLGALKDNPSFLYNDYVSDVVATDPHTLKITLQSSNAAFIAIMSSVEYGVVDSKVAQQHGGDAKTARTGDQDPLTQWLNQGNSCGTGPYKLTSWDKASQIELDRNPDYWGDAPKLDKIIYRNIVKPNEQLQSLQRGEVDLAFAVDPDSVDSVKSDSTLQLLEGPSLALEYLAMNVTPQVGGPLQKKQLRQAIAHAIDYDGIINGLLNGGGVRPAAPVPLGLLGTEDVKDLAYQTDLKQAQSLFDESGVGQVELTLTYGAGDTTPAGLSRDTLAPKLKSDIERIKGLTIKLKPMDSTQRLSDYRAGKLQFTMSDWSADYPDVHTYADPFGRPSPAGAATHRIGYANPQIGTWLDEGIKEQDPAKRKQIYIDIQKALIEDVPFIVEFQPIYRSPARKEVQGVSPHGVYILQLRYASKTG